ncbi:beta-ketoacyl-[acyl-carrier-protein] synthase family protein [Oleiagrimonas sp. C23AA]|uniref:beta-ketoacyl-[acyl-carrier-protein] synthase family protein n=1 Tax=Oleiagrimonas sp. C23AA TaxID=2719047 RepID=UPI001421CDDB|nr:beta-ketoacyl-[acyl-carrier-protein] synthase family protein [Oleiagrimonas sp. C23AA]NII11126.1 beta-ketoacyl-[acyl-carrier-protein] synthase family protein [Oleiagrimonas sp. C23AA]
MNQPAGSTRGPGPAERRVVITGRGAVSALGTGQRALWQAMVEGRSGIRPLHMEQPAQPLRMKVAAQALHFDASVYFVSRILTMLDRVSQMALVAAREAVAESGVDFSGDTALRTCTVIGTGVGGEMSRDEQTRRVYQDQAPRVHPLSIVRLMPNAPASQISMEMGLMGPAFGVTSACASSNHAIAQAVAMLRSGLADVAIAGGTESCFSLPAIRAWEAMRVVADDTCRPFCRQRTGMVLGEGAGIFVLETLQHAQARGATILAEIAGVGMSADAGDIVSPTGDGAARAMQAALDDAGLRADEVGYINAHGTATPANDPVESQAIRQVFQHHADRLAVSSTKGVHGHALGAAGALELVAAIGALREEVIPPTCNFIDADPACDLDYVPNTARQQRVDAVLSNSFAFGGLNAVLALRRFAH